MPDHRPLPLSRDQNLGEAALLLLDVVLVVGGIAYTLAPTAAFRKAVEVSLLVLLGLSLARTPGQYQRRTAPPSRAPSGVLFPSA